MKPRVKYLKFLLTGLLASALGSMVAFVSAPIIRILFNTGGSKWFWSHAILFSAIIGVVLQSPTAGFMLLSTWAVIGFYGEFESRGHAGKAAAFLALIFGVVIGTVGPYLWMKFSGQDLLAEIKYAFETYLAELKKSSTADKAVLFDSINVESLLKLIPGILFVMHTLSLATALVFDRQFAFLAQFRFERIASELRLSEFRLPDWTVWVAIAAFSLSFLGLGGWPSLQMAAINVCIGLAALYFLQGLAILEVGFLVYRVGFFIRLFAYIFLVGQLFPILIGLGFIDYWLDLRTRMRRSKMTPSGSNNGEHL